MEYLGLYNYWIAVVLLMTGFYAVIAKRNMIKKLIGLSLFQAAVFLLYITMDKVEGGTAPIFTADGAGQIFSNPLPQVLILTAIVVGISTTALGLAIVVRTKEEYGSIEEDEIQQMDGQETDSNEGSPKNSDFFVSARKPRAEDRNV
ncbi:MAG: cation:proton antiporter subunit C [Gammaproteobacteria bacterium]|nr:cation:proton antiporter subunit C [Gammaproteobacteria bacterium]